MRSKLLVISFISLIALTGCVSLNVVKATNIEGKDICIVDNPAVWQTFRDAYERRIQAKGYKTQIVADAATCQITTTYTADYGFHWGAYLAAAELKIFKNGVQIGQALYKAPHASPAKHGRVENKIETMVAQLLP